MTATATAPTLVSDSLEFGRTQWQAAWRSFATQWSQPQLMKLAELTLGERCLHSSQIHGFTTGKLRDPAPKCLMVIGRLNLAIAQANGADVISDYKCPMNEPGLWHKKRWLQDGQGNPLNPSTVFLAITGLLDLGMSQPWVFPDDAEEITRILRLLGKELRMNLAKNGIDWFEHQFPQPIHALVMNEGCNTDLVAQNAGMIAEFCQTDSKTLWDKVTHQI